jgi:hypothetical protein
MKRTAVLVAIWLLILFLLPAAMLRMLYCIATNQGKAFIQAKGFDRAGSALTNGSDNEYISSRAYQAMQKGKRWGCILCRILDSLDPDHCRKSAGQ